MKKKTSCETPTQSSALYLQRPKPMLTKVFYFFA
jgi:hypothetical protein